MLDITNMSSKTVIKEQYKSTDNLKLRKNLHDKYSINKIGFQKWMFEQYPFYPKMKVLELGSGRGELWKYYFESEELQGYEMDITLSDLSDGMVEYMQQNYLGEKISVRRIDIEDIPFENETFDLIIANSMLYHVKDIDLALSEVRRVLKKHGLFFCSTFGLNGMTRYLYCALDDIGIVEDYVEYIYSMASMQGLEQYNILLNYFNSQKVNGYLHIPKEYGMFVAGNE